mmetsp:Transcript_113013/g.364905  ORF Transcript_113013/g.364905 Transcript_113013/m.364905 type:complete len:205 (+) Transcript_113013:1940-2554(+)
MVTVPACRKAKIHVQRDERELCTSLCWPAVPEPLQEEAVHGWVVPAGNGRRPDAGLVADCTEGIALHPGPVSGRHCTPHVVPPEGPLAQHGQDVCVSDLAAGLFELLQRGLSGLLSGHSLRPHGRGLAPVAFLAHCLGSLGIYTQLAGHLAALGAFREPCEDLVRLRGVLRAQDLFQVQGPLAHWAADHPQHLPLTVVHEVLGF